LQAASPVDRRRVPRDCGVAVVERLAADVHALLPRGLLCRCGCPTGAADGEDRRCHDDGASADAPAVVATGDSLDSAHFALLSCAGSGARALAATVGHGELGVVLRRDRWFVTVVTQ